MTHEMAVNRGAIYKANLANKSAAAALKSRLLGESSNETEKSKDAPQSEEDQSQSYADEQPLAGAEDNSSTPASALGKRKAELIDEDDAGTPGRNSPNTSGTPAIDADEPPEDNVRLWEEGYADRYYENKFHVDPKDIGFRNKVAGAYVEGLAWVLLYYFQGCPSWTWYYPYHYAPFAADFVDLAKITINFEKGTPFKPFEQLMGVLPAASNHAIPEVFRSLMTDEESDILDFYPEKFPIDLNGKKFAWQGVAILPFIDEKRLLKAMAERYPLLSADDKARNEMGRDVLLISDRHPLYEDIATKFYSKRQGSPKFKLNPKVSEGLAGKVEKNEEYLPQSALSFPLDGGSMPDLDDDHSIRYVELNTHHATTTYHSSSVHYDIPRSNHIHKSMLLRGVKFPPSALDQADVEATRNRAGRSGRSYGGAPLRGDHGGRGRGQISYADARPNPFAAHLNPGFNNVSAPGNYWATPPAPSGMGWAPPPPGSDPFMRGPPPPPTASYPHGYAPPVPGYPYPPAPLAQNAYQTGGQHRGGYANNDRGGDGYRPPYGSGNGGNSGGYRRY